MTDSLNPFRKSFIVMSAPAKLVLLVLLTLFITLIGSLLALVLSVPIFHLDITTIGSLLTDPDLEHIAIIKYFQIIQSVSMFLIPGILAAWLFSEHTAGYLYANRKPELITLLLVFMALVAAIPMLNRITAWNEMLDFPGWLDGLERRMVDMEESAEKLTQLFLVSRSTGDLLLNLLMIAVLPALGEELLFRGLIQRLLIQWTRNNHIGIALAAFIFSFIHFQFFGFLPRFLLGLFFGYLLIWSRSLWVPVVAHLINNGLAVFYYHFTQETFGETPLDTIGSAGASDLLYILISVLLTSALLAGVYFNERRNNPSAGVVIR
ncbi:MAG: CPBP family intramembrane metalloprotease [Bacteroidales bacterium]|nr:CPBP family intramembrane metalloprotease [Bacteroidales bacterium]